ncbi:glycoside hydrolase family 35 protein [Streptococcus sp.]|nr:beta-galactosidase family protein [Streptococcus sp.]
MPRFEVRDQFLLDGKAFKILSGSIHYFRVPPADWYASLYNLKALGFNTVETYIPWNFHEEKEGIFDASGEKDFEAFLDLAQELGLYAIIRPSPYICAEWEFGGLPAWLLTKNIRIRSSDEKFLTYLARYYDFLLPKLVKHQLDNGGNILMFQIENEYGSYGEDKVYLRKVRDLMLEGGISQPLFTSDGPWRATLRAGSLIEDDILVTGNFGSSAQENFAQMQAFFDENGKTWPLMCMEFWDGWFNRWGQEVVRRNPKELVEAVMEAIELGSINLYMFHGGTNFGFKNGCSARGQTDLPQITSYDYDALLDESGNPTAKYFALQEALKARYPNLWFDKPLTKSFMEKKGIALEDKMSLLDNLDQLASYQINCLYPQNMEDLGQNEGYILYETTIKKDKEEERLRIIDARDRIHLYLDGQLMATQYQEEIGGDIEVPLLLDTLSIQILVENMGRVNYGHKLLAPSQRKGLGRGMMADLHFVTNWTHYGLDFSKWKDLDFSKEWKKGVAGLYRYQVNLDEPSATYLDVSQFGKGCVMVNHHLIGRFWDIGPTLSLYIPKEFFRKGANTVLIFETEGRYAEAIDFVKTPIYKEM